MRERIVLERSAARPPARLTQSGANVPARQLEPTHYVGPIILVAVVIAVVLLARHAHRRWIAKRR